MKAFCRISYINFLNFKCSDSFFLEQGRLYAAMRDDQLASAIACQLSEGCDTVVSWYGGEREWRRKGDLQ